MDEDIHRSPQWLEITDTDFVAWCFIFGFTDGNALEGIRLIEASDVKAN
jgi:hypothetical protein